MAAQGFEPELAAALDAAREGPLVFLSGAGISAESGIPTFRGKEGYWTVGARDYHPQEMATHAAFERMPKEVWRWYLYRRSVCRAADPNPAHQALAELDAARGDVHLVTQNVDGLHRRAGTKPERLYEVHGNIDYLRCTRECSTTLHPIPDGLVPAEPAAAKLAEVSDATLEALRCPDCGAPGRPHVLWFDEVYREDLYRADSSLEACQGSSLLVVIGSSGAAALPMHATAVAARAGACIVDINPDENPFSKFCEDYEGGFVLRGGAGEWVPRLCAALS